MRRGAGAAANGDDGDDGIEILDDDDGDDGGRGGGGGGGSGKKNAEWSGSSGGGGGYAAASPHERVPPEAWYDQEVLLLMLDPGVKAADIRGSLSEEGIGWEKLVKRGLHTLKERVYEMVVIDQGSPLLTGAALERWKVIDEEHVFE